MSNDLAPTSEATVEATPTEEDELAAWAALSREEQAAEHERWWRERQAAGRDLVERGKRLYALLDAPDVAERGLPGCVITEYQRCNKPRCRCRHGLLHGPYYYWYGRLRGVTWKKYLRREEAPRIVAFCQRHRDQRWTRARSRAFLRELKRNMRQLDALLDEVGWEDQRRQR